MASAAMVANTYVHVDFAHPFMSKAYLLVVNAHLKVPEIIEMTSTTTQKTIIELCKMFAAYGLLAQLCSFEQWFTIHRRRLYASK